MRGKSIVSLSLVLVLVSVLMMGIQPVRATPYEYELYVDGFTADWVDWSQVGDTPYLNAPNDGNYIEASEYGQLAGSFTFENINLPPCEVITKVVLEGYTNGPFDLTNDFDVYTTPDWVWLGSLYATGVPAWVTRRWYPSWTVDEVYPAALTEAGLNSLQVLVHFFTRDRLPRPPAQIDSLRLKVYTAISATIDFTPNTINAKSSTPYLKCKITLSCGFNASDINQSTILLDDFIAPSWFGTPTDSTLKVEFNMTEVKPHIANVANDILQGDPVPSGGVDVPLTVTFNLTDGTPFQGSENVTYIVP